MTYKWLGWARCHPKCNWFTFAEDNAYEECWQKLYDEVAATMKKQKKLVISMVVLPHGEHPAFRQQVT